MRPALLLLLLAACGPKAAPRGPDPGVAGDEEEEAPTGVIELEAVRIDVIRDEQGARVESSDARALLIDGNDALMQGQYDDAIAAYDRLLRDFPESQLVPAAWYNSGIAFERKGDAATAVTRYREAIAREADDPGVALDARFRLADLLAGVKRWAESEREFMAILEREDLGPADRIEAASKLGYVRLEQKDYVGAEETLRDVLAYHKEIEATEHLESIYFVVMAQYYLAAIPQRQFEAVPLRYPEEQMAKDLDHKSDLFLLARDRYVKAASYGNLYWTSASLYQLGAMYRKFWDDFMLVPVPADLDEAAQKEYVKLINKNDQIRTLLEKALTYHEKNIDLGRSVPQPPHWVAESARAAAEIRDFMARQARGELFVPGSIPRSHAPEPAEKAPREYVPARAEL